MDLHAQFQQQIQAEADPRLTQGIYADWLEEQGDPRAELLRFNLAVRELPRWPASQTDFRLVRRGFRWLFNPNRWISEEVVAHREWTRRSRIVSVHRFLSRRPPVWFWWEQPDIRLEPVQVQGKTCGYVDRWKLLRVLDPVGWEEIRAWATVADPTLDFLHGTLDMTREQFLRLAVAHPHCFIPCLPADEIPFTPEPV